MMNWTDAVQAICAIISTIGGIGALGVSAWQIYLASKQMRETSKQSKQESEDRNRPYISMDVVPGLGGVGCWDLKISNTEDLPQETYQFHCCTIIFYPMKMVHI